eukprot:3186331-Rhodomonas_salina.1
MPVYLCHTPPLCPSISAIRRPYALCSTDLAYATAGVDVREMLNGVRMVQLVLLGLLCRVEYCHSVWCCLLYAMSATCIAYAAVCLRACYAMPGTGYYAA